MFCFCCCCHRLCPSRIEGDNSKEIVFDTYHVALSLAVVTVCAILGLEVGGDSALGGHCV